MSLEPITTNHKKEHQQLLHAEWFKLKQELLELEERFLKIEATIKVFLLVVAELRAHQSGNLMATEYIQLEIEIDKTYKRLKAEQQ